VCRPFVSSEATKQYFPVMQFASLYKVAVRFKSVGEILKRSKVTEQYFPVVMFRYYAVLTRWLQLLNLCVAIQMKTIEQ